jgi:hypothetical protein
VCLGGSCGEPIALTQSRTQLSQQLSYLYMLNWAGSGSEPSAITHTRTQLYIYIELVVAVSLCICYVHVHVYICICSRSQSRTHPDATQSTASLTISDYIHALNLAFTLCCCGDRIVKQVKGKETELYPAVWSILNDSLNTDACLRFPAKRIAAAAVVLASEFLRSRGNLKPATHAVLDAIGTIERSGSIFGHEPSSIPPVVEALLDAYEQGNPGGTMYSTIRNKSTTTYSGVASVGSDNENPAKRTKVE